MVCSTTGIFLSLFTVIVGNVFSSTFVVGSGNKNTCLKHIMQFSLKKFICTLNNVQCAINCTQLQNICITIVGANIYFAQYLYFKPAPLWVQNLPLCMQPFYM
jgi:hypothetical protein